MSAQALYRKWRSQAFDEIVAQEHVTRTLRNALRDGRVAHAYLFTGPRGTGKTSMARLLAKAVNCIGETEEKPCNQCAICRSITDGSSLDLIEIDAASNRGIDEVRDLRDKVNFRPNECRYRVYILDEAHMLTTPAFNALLKTLEEPPAHAIFVLVTTEPQNIPMTIISRCQRFDFHRIGLPEIVAHLQRVAAAEGFQITADALEAVARQATGSMRDALSLLDQLMAYRHEEITLARVQEILGNASSEAVATLARAIVTGDVAQGLRLINDTLDSGVDPRQFNKELLEYLRGVLLAKIGGESALVNTTKETLAEMRDLANRVPLARLVVAIRVYNQAGLDLKEAIHPRLPLEMALVEAALPVESIAEVSQQGMGQEDMAESVATAPTKAPTQRRQEPTVAAPAVPEASHAPAGQEVAPAEPEPAPAGGDASLSLTWFVENWKDILAAVRARNRSVEALLNRSCELVAVHENVLTLAFFHEFHQQKIEQAKNREVVEAAISEAVGKPFAIKCVRYEGDGARRAAQQERKEIKEKQEKAIESDPIVRAMVDRGGKITDVRPLEG